MKPVTQQHPEGCALACAAMLSGLSYGEIVVIGEQLNIRAGDKALYSDTALMRRLMNRLGICIASSETPFADWSDLPNRALLATNWHVEEDVAVWHWAVFLRKGNSRVVLDPAAHLDNPVRKDLSVIHPEWFIEVIP